MTTCLLHVSVTILLTLCVFFGPPPPEAFAGPGEVTGYFSVQSFDWREYAEDVRAVRETGPLFGVGVVYPMDLGDKVFLRPVGEVFGGSVDYDGHACDVTGSSCEASTTTVNYFGIKIEGDIGRTVSPGSVFFEPFAGLGLRYWSRNIDSGTTATGVPTASFSEDWITLYARGGLRAGVVLSRRNEVFLVAGAKLPFFTQNTAHTSELGQGEDLDLRPGKQVSFFGEIGMTLDRFSAGLFYDSFRYPQSPTISNGFSIGYQPRSAMDLYGLKLGWTF